MSLLDALKAEFPDFDIQEETRRMGGTSILLNNDIRVMQTVDNETMVFIVNRPVTATVLVQKPLDDADIFHLIYSMINLAKI